MLGSEVKLKVKMKFRKQLSPSMMYVKEALIYCQPAFRILFDEGYWYEKLCTIHIVVKNVQNREFRDMGSIGVYS